MATIGRILQEYLLEHETMERDAFLEVFGEKAPEKPETDENQD